MGLIKVIRSIFKGMDKDTNLKVVRPENYLDAMDITDVDRNNINADTAIQPNTSTKYGFDLGSIEQVFKKYRVVFDTDPQGEDCSITFTIVHRRNTYQVVVPVNIISGDDGGIIYNAIETAFQNNFDQTVPPSDFFRSHQLQPVSITQTHVEFDIWFPSWGPDDYTISATYFSIPAPPAPQVALPIVVQPIQDAMSLDKVGVLTPIAFAQCDNKVFIWSTTGDEEVVEKNATGFTLIPTGDEPPIPPQYAYKINGITASDVSSNEEIRVVYKNNAAQVLYGNFIAQNYGVDVAIKNIGIVPPSTPAPGPVINVSSPTAFMSVKKYVRTASCIGVAEKNPVTGIWTYTELLRTTNFNFRTYKQIDATVIKANDGYILRWTDDLNPMRLLYYRGEFVTGGFLNIFNPENNYNLDTIEDASRMILSSNVATVTAGTSLDVTNVSRKIRGAKPEGNYQVFVRFLTYDDQYSVFSPGSNITTIYKNVSGVNITTLGTLQRISNVKAGVQAHNSTIISNSALIIKVSVMNPAIYKQVQVGIVQTVEDAWQFYALPPEDIGNNTTLEIIDTGYNPQSYIQLDATLLNELAFNIKLAKNLTMFDGYAVASNVELAPRYDLTAWAQSINLTASRDEIAYGKTPPTDSILDQYANAGSYQWLRYATDERMSYSPFETVRIGIKIWFKGVGAPSVYWIDDITINDTSGLTDYAIGKGTSDFNLYRYFINASNINFDYILPDGTVLREIIEYAKIVRAEIPKEVLFVGFCRGTNLNAGRYTAVGNYYLVTPPAYTSQKQILVTSPDLEVTADQVPSGNDTKVYFYSCGRNYGIDLDGTATDYEVVENSGASDNNTAINWSTSFIANKVDYIPFYSSSDLTNCATTLLSGRSLRPVLSIELDSAPSFSTGTRGFIYFVKPIVGDKFPSIYSTEFFDVSHQAINIQTLLPNQTISIYSGDFFPQVSYFLDIVDQTTPGSWNRVVGFPCLNRYNQQLRTGNFPAYPLGTYRSISFNTMNEGEGDPYSVSSCFLPSRPFQNQLADNFETPYYPNQETGIYWSLKSLQTALFGSNRIFKFANNKVLEQTYGEIVGLVPLLGLSNQGVMLCLQERRVSLQYFDNTANLISDAGALLIGNGKVMERRGTDLTSYGCSDKWSIIKGISISGKETVYWFCSWANTFMRFGEDGTSNISETGLVDTFLNINTRYTQLKSNKTPADDWGCHGIWDSLNNRAIWTFRLAPKYTEFDSETGYAINSFVTDGDVWGYEDFPILYRAKIQAPPDTSLNDTTYWEEVKGYDSAYFKLFTIVYSENANSFKTFFTHLPRIYGAINNIYLSSDPRNPSNIFEHNAGENEAIYYGLSVIYSGMGWSSTPINNRIVSTNIGASINTTFPQVGGYFSIPDRTKVMVTINDKNYSIVRYIDNDTVECELIDSDDVLPVASGVTLPYSIVNCQDPYYEPIINEYFPKYFSFAGVEVQSDDTLKRIDYEAFTDSLGEPFTKSFTNKGEYEYFQGRGLAQIKQDTKNNPNDNTVSDQFVEGQVLRTKLKFRWGKRNKLNNFVINMVEQNKRFQ